MNLDDIPASWSKRFGLAVSPLFEQGEVSDAAQHHVFLDGGQGTFALTTSQGGMPPDYEGADWAWSSDIAHHVTVTPNDVSVVRWDSPRDVTRLSHSSVERNLDDFYKFITADRIRSTRSVVYHLLSLFRRIRSLASGAGIPDARVSDLFSFALRDLIADGKTNPNWTFAPDVRALYETLDRKGLDSALSETRTNESAFGFLKLFPTLAIRHAGGLLFQEAHFELVRAPSVDFFGYIGAPKLDEVGRGGAHFTPPALARTLVEQALSQISDLTKRATLTICDPACGSGVFLHEVLRALRRLNFKGRLTLVGRDISPIAISMATFVLNCAIKDWAPPGGIGLDLDVADSLEPKAIPQADLIVMNPPFISWGSQNDTQRAQLISIVGRSASSRGDLSMAFVTKAIESLRSEGVVATLFPASLLSQGAADQWRKDLADTCKITLLASIGDYGLFSHALVQVACAVLRKGPAQSTDELTALVAGDDMVATGDALRTLRKIDMLPPSIPIVGAQWSVFALRSEFLRAKPTWRLRPPAIDAALHKLEGVLPTLAELFDVRQGVQTGYNPALLLKHSEWASLPKKEKRYFRLATMTDSIKNGVVVSPYYLFFPHTPNGPLFDSEKAVKQAVPEYYQKYLAPNKARLSNRASIRRSERKDWWGLMEPRSWSFQETSRLISKYFSGEGGFFVDVDASYLPSTGFAWLPKARLQVSGGNVDDFPVTKVLFAYSVLFNSAIFNKMLQYYAPHVSGGQFDLSPRYVNAMPLPNLAELATDPIRGRCVRQLALIAEKTSETALRENESLKQSLVAEIYGQEIIAAL